MEEELEAMNTLETLDHVMNKKWRFVMSHKWNTSKKLLLGAWILDVFHAFQLFCLWQAFQTKSPSFDWSLSLLTKHYKLKLIYGNLAEGGVGGADVLEQKDLSANMMSQFSCHPNGTQTRDVHYKVAVALWRAHLLGKPCLLPKMKMRRL